MLKQTTESVFQDLVKRRGSLVLDANQQLEILKAAKRVRSVDYVCSWEIINGTGNAELIRTRANWLFIMTGIGIYSQHLPGQPLELPRFIFRFENLPFSKSFREEDPANLGTVPARLVLGNEDSDHDGTKFYHFEEYRNELFVLPERAIIETDVRPFEQMNGTYQAYNRGKILYTGIEVSLEVFENG